MEKSTVKKWKAPNGNVCFRFPMRMTFERPWIIIKAVLIAAAICCVEFFIWDSYRLLAPVSIILFVFFLWWTDIPARGNEAVISNVVHEIMDKLVNEDAKLIQNHIIQYPDMLISDDKSCYWKVPK